MSSSEGGIATNQQGHPVFDNHNQRTVGARGPATLENYQFLEKISHFDRERIPERGGARPGVRGYGTFTATGRWGDEPIERYPRAKLFSTEGKQTDVALRFSTVIGGRDSSEVVRDPRGLAVKFYTEDGNGDLLGNTLGVFFIRDAIKFPDVIHSLIRCVAAGRPIACKSRNYTATGSTTPPAGSSSRYGSHTSPVSTNEPTRGTTNAARSWPRSSLSITDRDHSHPCLDPSFDLGTLSR